MKRTRKNTRLGALLLIILVLIGLIILLFSRAGTGLKVSGVTLGEVTDSTVALQWEPVKHADGYAVFLRADGSGDFTPAATVGADAQTGCVLEKLTQATEYEIYVAARKGEKETKHPAVLHAMTLPAQETVSGIAQDEGGKKELTVSFAENPKAGSFELQYMTGEQANFDNAKTLTAQAGAHSITVAPIEFNQQYYFRVRALIGSGKDALAGAWSEPEAYFAMEGVDLSGIDPNKPMIALTFDDGPGYNDASERILDTLEKYGVPATFFMVGTNVLDHPKNLERKAALHCELGNHTMRHDHYGTGVTAADIKDCSDAIMQTAGARPTAFRSPGGNTTELIRQECANENMALYYWSIDTQDWKYRNADSVYNAVMNHASDGDIVLMHEIYGSTADAVERMVPALLDKGFQIVTCRQLIAAKTGKPPESGTQYLDAETIKNETH